MSIEISCSNCRAQLKAKDSLAGKRITCPKCKSPITVPNDVDFVEAEVLDDLPPTETKELEFLSLDLAELGTTGYFEGEFKNPTKTYGQPFPTPATSVKAKSPSVGIGPPKTGLSQKTILLIGLTSVGGLLGLLVTGMILWSYLSPKGMLAQTQNIDSTPTNNSLNNGETPESTSPTPAESQSNTSAPASLKQSSPKPSTPTESGGETKKIESGESATNATPSANSPSRSVDLLDRLKSATVFIKVKTTTGGQSGSGFLLESSGCRGDQRARHYRCKG